MSLARISVVLSTCIIIITGISCNSNNSHQPIGIESSEKALDVVKKAHLYGDWNQIYQHIDESGLHQNKETKARKLLKKWVIDSQKWTFDRIEIFSYEECSTLYDPSKLPDNLIDNICLTKDTTWNIKPEQFILIYENSGENNRRTTFYGVFRNNEEWYFASRK